MNSSSILFSMPKKTLAQLIPVSDFTVELKGILPEAVWPWVFSALRQDSLIWDTLQGEFGRRALGRANPRPDDFTPAALALLALDIPVRPEDLRSVPLEPVDSSLKERADRASKTLSSIGNSTSPDRPGLTFVQSGLLAVHFRERRRAIDAWQGLSEELVRTSSTVLACLYGIISDPEEMILATLLARGVEESQAIDLGLRAFFSQPLQPDLQLEILERMLRQVPDKGRVAFLKGLSALRPDQAVEVSRLAILSGVEPVKKEEKSNDGVHMAHPGPSGTTHFEAVYGPARLAEIHHFARQHDQEMIVLGEALQGARRLEAWLTARRAEASEKNGDHQAALEDWKQALELDPESNEYLGRLGRSLLIAGRNAEAQARLNSCSDTAKGSSLLVVRARLALQQGNLESARQYASQAAGEISLSPENDVSQQTELAHLLLELNLPEEAVQVIKQLVVSHPEQAEPLALLSAAYNQFGVAGEAVSAAHLAVSLDPERGDYRRLLAGQLEASGDWESALVERSIILDRQGNETSAAALSTDLRALAHCSLKAGRPDQAIEACQKALHLQPEDGLAFALLGQSKAAQGDELAALENLQQAIQLAPGQAAPWLALAGHYETTGQSQKAMETLQTATRAAPDSPEVHLALGEAHLAQKAPTQALAILRRAADLARSTSSAPGCSSALIALRLGQTLHQLGHLPEARHVLESAYRQTPSHPDLAYGYAQVLIALGEQRLALTPIETVLDKHPDILDPYLDYARCLMDISNSSTLAAGITSRSTVQPAQTGMCQKAIPALRRVLELAPDHAEAKALLAEALAASGDLLPAIDAYRSSMETSLAKEPAWQTRLSLGLGQVALKMGQIETAIAALQEANAIDPLNPRIQRTLSEAYDAAGLTENAFQAARAALQLAPEDIDVLTWFADQALELRTRPGIAPSQAQTEAINALNQATTLAPERTDLLLRLGQVQIQAGEAQAARNTFNKLTTLQRQSPTPDRNITDLYTAAKYLLTLGDPLGAESSLELALQSNRRRTDWKTGQVINSTPTLLDLLADLAAARYQAGHSQAALEALEQAIAVAPEEARLYLDKADLHLEMSQPCSGQLEPELAGDDPAGAQPDEVKQEQDIDHIQSALACLEAALQLKPSDPSLYQRAALIQRVAGDLPAALTQATRSIQPLDIVAAKVGEEGSNARLDVDLSGRALAGELARAQFKPGLARKFVAPEWPAAGSYDAEERIGYYCLRAELALEAGEQLQATDDLAAVLDQASEHPRVLAIQARLLARRGDLEVAQQMLRDAIEALSPSTAQEWPKGPAEAGPANRKNENQALDKSGGIRGIGLLNARERLLNNQLAVADTAVELHHWAFGMRLMQAITTTAPLEPFFQLHLARTLVLRAEFQSLCQDLGVVRQAPGEGALNGEACDLFSVTVKMAEDSLNRWPENSDSVTSGRELVQRWQARGLAAFLPSLEAAEKLNALAQDPEDVTARVTCLRKVGEVAAAGLAARAYPQHPRVLIQLALALASEKPRQALAAAHAAVEAVQRPQPLFRAETHSNPETTIRVTLPSTTPVAQKEDLPLVYALLARLVHICGNRAGDRAVAVEAIENALSIWPDEPRWHALAAQIYSGRSSAVEPYDQAPVVKHLEQAITLEPKNPSHYLALGQVYLRDGASREAIIPLEQATRLAPDLPEPWLLLARAFRDQGDLEAAAVRAERAVTLAPEDLAPLLLRGEIALEANSPRGALSRAQAALLLCPDDPAAQLMLARSLSGLDRSDEALAALDKALAQVRDPLPFQIERARLLLRSESQDAALQALQELADQYPSEPNVLSLLAECLAEAGQREAAIQTAQRALRAGHEGPAGQSPLEHANIHHQLGRLLRRSGQLDGAIHHLSEAIQHAPGFIEPYLELGHTYQERREYTQALNAYHQATLIAPGDPRGYYHAGFAYKENKDYLSAESMLRKAANLSPEDLSIHRLLAAVVALNLVHNRRESVRETSAHGTHINA